MNWLNHENDLLYSFSKKVADQRKSGLNENLYFSLKKI